MKPHSGSSLATAPLLAVPMGATQAPVVIEAGWSYDGSSVGVVFTDARGSVTTCCFDHRQGTRTPGRLFVDGGRPDAAGARPATGVETRLILARLQAAIDAVYPREVQEILLRKRYDTEVSSLDHEAWLILRELTGRSRRAADG